MAHDRRMSLLRLEEGLGQRIPLPALDVNKRHLWQLSPIEEDRVVKKQKEEDRVVKKQEDDDNDVNQEHRKSFRMKLPPLQFATWRTLTGKEWKDYNKCLEQSEGLIVGMFLITYWISLLHHFRWTTPNNKGSPNVFNLCP